MVTKNKMKKNKDGRSEISKRSDVSNSNFLCWSNLIGVVVPILIIMCAIIGILIVASTTSSWDNFQAWLTIIMLLGIIIAFAGYIMGSQRVLYRSKRYKRGSINSYLISSHGELKIQSIPNIFETQKERTLRHTKAFTASTGEYSPLLGGIIFNKNSSTGPWNYTRLNEIQVLLINHQSREPLPTPKGIWYYNNYFDRIQTQDKTIYARYFQPEDDLPNNVPPSMIPGLEVGLSPGPTTNDMGLFIAPVKTSGMLFTLEEIRLTSLYGGSVRMSFSLIEDFSAELTKDEFAWDLNPIKMNIFVIPKPGQFWFNANRDNPARPFGWRSTYPIHIQFEYSVNATYQWDGTKWNQIARDDQNALDKLNEAITEFSRLVEISGRMSEFNPALPAGRDRLMYLANQFIYAFLHVELKGKIATDNTVVDAIQITDDYINLFTHEGRHIFKIQARVEDIYFETEEINPLISHTEEVRVIINATVTKIKRNTSEEDWIMNIQEIPRKKYAMDLEGWTVVKTPWYNIGSWTVEEFRDNAGEKLLKNFHVKIHIRMREKDTGLYGESDVIYGKPDLPDFRTNFTKVFGNQYIAKLYKDNASGKSLEELKNEEARGLVGEEKTGFFLDDEPGNTAYSSCWGCCLVFQISMEFH